MNISINISLKALQLAMWSCFINGRDMPLDLHKIGCDARFNHDENHFHLECFKGGKSLLRVDLSRHNTETKSADPYDYSPVFFNIWVNFLQECRKELGMPTSVVLD